MINSAKILLSISYWDDSLKSKSIRGIIWSIGGHGIGELVRLASNLLLTRLLVPEYFGQMLMVNVFMMGLQLFSDVGIGPSIIQNPRGNDQKFLNTAWTIQVIRGFVLWCIASLLAYPFSILYGMQELSKLIPVVATIAIIGGFNSTKLFTLNRRLYIGKIILLQISQTIVSVGVMITWAFISPTVWSLVMGSVFGACFRCVLSFFIASGPNNRFAWDQSSFNELFKFGKWILVSTAIGFLADRGDRLILGKFMTDAELGMLSIALVLSKNPVKLISDIGTRVLFPLYTRFSENDPILMRNKIARVRYGLMAVSIPPLCLFSLFGSNIVKILWDPRYEGAGWMLQILSAGSIVLIVNGTLKPVLLAMGNSFKHMIYTFSDGIIIFVSMGLGIYFIGSRGGLIGIAIAPLLSYAVLAALVYPYKILTFRIDFIAVLISIFMISMVIVVP